MTNIESLHTHTTLSDGKLSHKEMFDLAESLGVSVIAFTDHDAVPPPEIVAELETLRDRKTKWIIGSEITAGLPKELESSGSASMHIIGLFLDPTNEALVVHCRRAQEARIKRMNYIVNSLKNLGFNISADDCLEMSGGESVGRPHIVLALQKYPENNLVLEKIRLEMADEARRDSAIQEKYTHMMQVGEREYPYTLFLTPTAFRNCYIEPEYMPDLDEAVKLIRDAGGLAFLAHYFTIKSKISLEFLEKLIAEKRFDGLEVVYGLREYGTNEEIEMTRQRVAVHEIVKRHGALAAGGSDAHTQEDLERYVSNDWFSGETAGFAANILATGRVNKQFSSLE
ncbi:MAG: PHP domain-containing protein [Candidatus Paceibacterota bacterium]|jgi:predicted metal-dependent phosphoesterase TrpH